MSVHDTTAHLCDCLWYSRSFLWRPARSYSRRGGVALGVGRREDVPFLVVCFYMNCRKIEGFVREKDLIIDPEGVIMAELETCVRQYQVKSEDPDLSGICRIRLASDNSTALVEFLDERSRDVLCAILREVVSFRTEQLFAGKNPCAVLLKPPFRNWFNLVLGDVFSDRFKSAEFQNGSDLKYSFGLRIVRSSYVPVSCPETSCLESGNHHEKSGIEGGSLCARVEHKLLLPPLWRITRTRRCDDSSISTAAHNDSGGELCLLRKLPSGRWHGRILSAEESKNFRQIVLIPGDHARVNAYKH